MLKLITAATSLAVSVERAKERLRIGGTDSDLDLTALILAATKAVEHSTGRTIQPSQWEYTTDCWEIEIPAVPVRVVTEIAYLDADHVEQVIDPANYYWNDTSSGATVNFITGYSFPVLSDRDGAIIIRFDSGYDDTGSGSGGDPDLFLPKDIELAILFLVGHWYNVREPVNIGNITSALPLTFEFLASPLRIYR